MSADRDPRLTPARPDLAAASLRGAVDAPRYADGLTQTVIAGLTPVRRAPSHNAPLLTEALYGERVVIYETDDEGWAWGQLEADGYVGFIPASALVAPVAEPTHRVAVLRTFIFPEPSIKAPPAEALPMGATVAVLREQDRFAVTAQGFIPSRHLAPLDHVEPDFVSVAERFVGVPYLWGGKSSLGIDCSGLLQVALAACGIAAPRDSDMQEAALGTAVAPNDIRSGDLLFWKGHVAIARDTASIVHANAHHMMVAVESLAGALARIDSAGTPLSGVRRLR